MFIFICFLWILVKLFEKKFIVLLSMEGLMLSVVMFLSYLFLTNFSSFFLLIFMAVLMVLDSVFSVSLLICNSRCSTLSMKLMS